NISFPTAITNREGDTFSNNRSIGLSEFTNLTLTILPPLEFTDHVQLGMENVAKVIRPIGELWTLLIPIGGAVASIILYVHKKGKKANPP
ncbi:MAG TPA: hypothetical protein VFH04_05250, partial [Nitrososphaeraceae archaeon]|nr:hypothetical protein [Nitrososphaeraceae archaeon]